MSEVFIVRKKERCSKKVLMVESLLFYKSWSRSQSRSQWKKYPEDRLRTTGCHNVDRRDAWSIIMVADVENPFTCSE